MCLGVKWKKIIAVYRRNYWRYDMKAWHSKFRFPVGLLAQLVERYTGIAEAKSLNPIQAWIFQGFFLQLGWDSSIEHFFIIPTVRQNWSMFNAPSLFINCMKGNKADCAWRMSAIDKWRACKLKQRDEHKHTLGPFIRGKIRRVLHKTRTFRINGTFRLK